ncbi:MAG TPA: radical SAM protein [Polyangiaceae bacterium]|nr:radical SAM protein [Polyangiaceae bacterium]
MISVLSRVPAFRLGRALGRPLGLPAALTVNVLYACNSRCKTCSIYEHHADVLTTDEYDRIFRSIGRSPSWVTFTGGEPFLRPDLPDIVLSFHDRCRPAVINMPTNGSFPNRVKEGVERIARAVGSTSVIVNLSIDEVGKAHDSLRGLRGNWELAMETASVLAALRKKHENLVFGVNTVISRFNEDRISDIAERVDALNPDSHVAEVAGRRVELGTERADIMPTREGLLRALSMLRARSRRTGRLIEALVASLRAEYYGVLEEHTKAPREVLPCYAGITSAHLMPEGKVWACCVLGEELGELRSVDYDFPSLWYGAQARSIRERIKREKCHCTLANQTYMNMLMDPRSLVRSGSRAARKLSEGALGA